MKQKQQTFSERWKNSQRGGLFEFHNHQKQTAHINISPQSNELHQTHPPWDGQMITKPGSESGEIEHFLVIFTRMSFTQTYEPRHDKTNKMSVRPAKIDQPGHPPSLIKVFAVRMKNPWVLSYRLSAQQRIWSDWPDAQADLSLRWAYTHFVGFVMSWLISWGLDIFVVKDGWTALTGPTSVMKRVTTYRFLWPDKTCKGR